MGVNFPVYTLLDVQGFEMYPGLRDSPGICHDFTPGLHLVAGVNGLGKSTLLLMLYHGVVGPAAVRNDDYTVPSPELAQRRDADRFRHRVPNSAKEARLRVCFELGADKFEAVRSLHDLSLLEFKLNGADQAIDDELYRTVVAQAMGVGQFADVIIILNLIVFMFETRNLLMWSPRAQRNALRVLFMGPSEARALAASAQTVAAANSAYRNMNFIVNRDANSLTVARAALATASSLGAEYNGLQNALKGYNEDLSRLIDQRRTADDDRAEALDAYERAKFDYDDLLREIEALKLARVASAFPNSKESGRYVLARLLGDMECLACGAEGGPLIEKWAAAVATGNCLVCGADQAHQGVVVSPTEVDSVRLKRAEARLSSARKVLLSAKNEVDEMKKASAGYQVEIDKLQLKRGETASRIREIAGILPPTTDEIADLERRIEQQREMLADRRREQRNAEEGFSTLFGQFKSNVEAKADEIRERFASRISEFLVERAEITLAFERAPIGESGQTYPWPTFKLSMTSGTYSSPFPRKNRSEVSMSQGEFIDLAFRLALIEAAAGSQAKTMVFDAPEASLDALFMRRAGAFLSRFTQDHSGNRLIVTSNLTNADMIPALFGAYEPLQGDPEPRPIPREERRSRVINLLELAAPTSAIELVGDRYRNLLETALFPPGGEGQPGL